MTREQEFNHIADRWNKATGHMSFWRMKVKHPDYLPLVAFGTDAIPWVLKRIADGDHGINWTMLLTRLSGTLPDYEPEAEGGFVKWDVKAAAKAWLKWGAEHGYPLGQ